MAAPPHKILRQVLVVEGCPPGAGPMLQALLREAFHSQLLPLIEQACDAQARPGHIDRIERLEIDLGRLSLGELEPALGQRFDACFSGRLAEAVRSAPPRDDALDLLAHYLDTGSLPWWADRADRHLLHRTLADLLARAPQPLLALLHGLGQPPQAGQRLALAFPDDLLARLTALLAPGWLGQAPAGPLDWLALLHAAAPGGHAPHHLRSAWWQEVLAAGLGSATAPWPQAAGATLPSAAAESVQALLTRLARRLGLDAEVLLHSLLRAATDPAAPAVLRAMAGPLQPLRRPAVPPPGVWDAGSRALLLQALAGLDRWDAQSRLARAHDRVTEQSDDPADDPAAPQPGLWSRLNVVIDRLPGRLLQQAAQALADMRPSSRADAPADPSLPTTDAACAALAALVAAALAQGLVDAAQVRQQVAALARVSSAQRQAAARLASRLRSALPPVTQSAVRPVPQPAANADPKPTPGPADALFIDNAGLVLLWPFLASFFQRLGLADSQRFADGAAQQRAVTLLQVLAAADVAPPEPLLPLNKLLCGLAPDAVVGAGLPITDAEIDACQALLAAVVQQAPVLQGMSPDALRGNFLLRSGRLGPRDGHWRLQVERLTHDIVLDRIPWGVQFVKLPWMPTLLQVDW